MSDMSAARGAKWIYEKFALIDQWAKATDRPAREWWSAAQSDGLTHGNGTSHERKIRTWLKKAITEAEGC